MTSLNRIAISIVPTAQFSDWVVKNDEDSRDLTPDEIRHTGQVVLIPYDAEEAEILEYLKSAYEGIFLDQLYAWSTDESIYPELTWENFQLSFDVTVCPVVDDVSGELPDFVEG